MGPDRVRPSLPLGIREPQTWPSDPCRQRLLQTTPSTGRVKGCSSDPGPHLTSELLKGSETPYVAYAANPFRPDLAGGSGTAFLPSGMQARLEEKLGDRAAWPLCSLDRKNEVLPETDFREVLQQVQEDCASASSPVDGGWNTYLALLAAVVVNPLIVMPFFTSLNGVMVSATILILVSGLSYTCTIALHQCLDALDECVPASEIPYLARDYAFIAAHAFGRSGCILATAIYTLDFWSSVVSNFVIIDSIWRVWLPLCSENRWYGSALVLCHAVITFGLLYAPAKVFSRVQGFAAISSIALVASVGIQAVHRLSTMELGFEWSKPLSPENVVLEMTSAVFTYGNMSILPKITAAWHGKHLERQTVLRSAFLTSNAIYIAFGILGVCAMNPAPPDEVFEMQGLLGRASQICFALKLQLCLPLLTSPCLHVMQDVLGISESRQIRLCCNFAFLMGSAILALTAGGRIDAFMSFVGAGVTTAMVMVLPPLMQLSLCRHSMHPASILGAAAISCTGKQAVTNRVQLPPRDV